MAKDYGVEMKDETTGESLGDRPIGEEFETREAAQEEANEIANELSELIGDEVVAGEVHELSPENPSEQDDDDLLSGLFG